MYSTVCNGFFFVKSAACSSLIGLDLDYLDQLSVLARGTSTNNIFYTNSAHVTLNDVPRKRREYAFGRVAQRCKEQS